MAATVDRIRLEAREASPSRARLARYLPDKRERVILSLCAASGTILGFSAPGFDQWLIAWVGLVSVLAASHTSRDAVAAAIRGITFGLFYNLIYFHWLLFIDPNSYAGTPLQFAWPLVNGFVLFCVAIQQGFVIAIFACLFRSIRWAPTFLPARTDSGRIQLPLLAMAPLLWVIILYKAGNLHCLLGVPWSMLEYSQYRLLPLVQCASIVGGFGVSFLIVLVNCLLLCLIASLPSLESLRSLRFPSVRAAIFHIFLVSAVLIFSVMFGTEQLAQPENPKARHISVSLIQGNVTRHVHHTQPTEQCKTYSSMTCAAPGELCIWPEWALPFSFTNHRVVFDAVATLSGQIHKNIVMGAHDNDRDDRAFNSVVAVTSSGKVIEKAYHKRFLVPFGEYVPWAFTLPPISYLIRTKGYTGGDGPVTFDFNGVKVAPLVCFESVAPELVCDSVRNGGQLLVNCSNTAWFRSSIMVRQMIAFSVMRAVETHRYFAYCTTIGPSAIIDSRGRILAVSARRKADIVTHSCVLENDITPFCKWCF